jgi:hypothetical protein
MMLYQAYLFFPTNQKIFTDAVNKEDTSPSIAFYHEVTKALPDGFDSVKRVVYRDWKVYFPPTGNYLTEMTWDMPTFDYIKSIHPDVLLLDRENIGLFSEAESVTNSVNPGNMQPVHEFYLAANNNRIPGYSMFFKNAFGMGFLKENLK